MAANKNKIENKFYLMFFFMIISLCHAQAVSSQNFVSKWDRVVVLAPGLVDGAVIDRLNTKDQIIDILTAEEEGYPVFYVDQDASGSGDGSSWTNAFTTIQPAIDLASLKEAWVWVAKGTYTGMVYGVDSGEYLVISAIRIRPKVMLFGGFQGVETRLIERDPHYFATIIHGEISPVGPRAVLMDHLTMIDGFEIKDSGFKDYTTPIEFNAGGAIRCGNWLSIIRNNIVHDNWGKDGAGISVWNGVDTYNETGFSPIIDHNVVYDNCGACGAGIHIRNSEAFSSNNIVVDNWHPVRSKGIEVVIDPNISDPPVVMNSIIWGNSNSVFEDLYNHFDMVDEFGDAAKAISQYNCIEQDGYGDVGLTTSHPRFISRENHDYRLNIESSCIDAGHPEGRPDADGTRADIGIFNLEFYHVEGSVSFMRGDVAVQGIDIQWQENELSVALTDREGLFVWNDAAKGVPLTLQCIKADETNVDPVLVTAYDAALTARHCLGAELFTDDVLLAADVDESGVIDLRDASLIARAAVGMPQSSASQALEWRFMPAARHYAAVSSNLTDQDFTASLLGDVSGDWPGMHVAGKLHAEINIVQTIIQAGDSIAILISGSPEIFMISADLHLNYDPALLGLMHIRTAQATSAFNVQYHEPQPGSLRIAMYGTQAVQSSDPILIVTFQDLTETPVETEIIATVFRINDVQLHLETEQIMTTVRDDIQPVEFGLRTNYPNPFNPGTMIEYTLTSHDQAYLILYDGLGREIRKYEILPAASGIHSTYWDGMDAFGRSVASGVYICMLQCGDKINIRKIIKIK
ncbi:T9SS type A sorting domain-containing protein [bacterium]|nr:T9SS type A sorting domain-containing protein [bacterium]